MPCFQNSPARQSSFLVIRLLLFPARGCCPVSARDQSRFGRTCLDEGGLSRLQIARGYGASPFSRPPHDQKRRSVPSLGERTRPRELMKRPAQRLSCPCCELR